MIKTIYSVLYELPGGECRFHECPFAPNVGEIVNHDDKDYIIDARKWFSCITPRTYRSHMQCVLFLKEIE